MQNVTLSLKAVELAAKITLESGGETYRAEDTALHMCDGFGFNNMQVLAIPTGILVTVYDDENQCYTRIIRTRSRGTHLNLVEMVNDVSRKVACHQMDAATACEKLEEIDHTPDTKQWLLVLSCAVTSGAFSVLFGGQWIDILIAMLCGIVTQLTVPVYGYFHFSSAVSALFSSFINTLIALLFSTFTACNTEAVIAGALMPLVPGLSMTNAIRDTIRGDLVSGSARGTEALTIAIMIAAGVGIMLSFWGSVL